MAALGIGVCTSDKVHGWESVEPAKKNDVQIEYLKAQHQAVKAWHELEADTDRLISEGRYAEIEERMDACKRLERLIHQLSPHSRGVVEK